MKDNEIDAMVREALSDEDRETFDKYSGDMSAFEMIGESFRGRNRWLTIYAFIWIFAFLGLAIWCGVKFYQLDADTASSKELVGWAVGFSLSMMTVGLLKIWFWLDMQRHATTREIKRLELAVTKMQDRPNKEA
jgi:hypothetical protein